MFQSTRPRGARLDVGNRHTFGLEFQSTRPRGARLPAGFSYLLFKTFQSTRPRGARRTSGIGKYKEAIVSIHAPTRGATLQRLVDNDIEQVSIHAPTRGATCGRSAGVTGCWVSIHAPTRGATCQKCAICTAAEFQSTRPRGARLRRVPCWGRSRCFNPRAHAGRDSKINFSKSITKEFQSTRPRGARPFNITTKLKLWKFQSTRPRGARHFQTMQFLTT